ncbi:hypothetical protein ACGFX8_00095 [Streptomyces sp. NPDC048362]|uniref:hypothetical protein n=1 Tax=Streptomyces sp. NPDC048362 TaxID=3365539 RepID=UPI003724C10D
MGPAAEGRRPRGLTVPAHPAHPLTPEISAALPGREIAPRPGIAGAGPPRRSGCVGASLGLGLPWVQVALAYFSATPALATATVIGYRVPTDRLPLLPGALTLSALIRAKAL